MAKSKVKAKAIDSGNTESRVDIWEELNDLHKHCLNMLSTTASIGSLLKNKEVTSKVIDLRALANAGEEMLTSFKVASENLDVIYAEHQKQDIGGMDPDSYFEAIMIGEKYHGWLSDFTTNVMPLADVLQEMLLEAHGEPH